MTTIIGKIIMANRSFMNYEFSLHKNRSLNDFLPDKRGIALSALATLAVCLISILIADRPIALAMRSVAPSIRTFFSYVTLFGNSTPYLTFLGMIFILFYPASKSESWRSHAEVLRKYALFSFFIFVSIALSGILTDVLKVIFARYRPVMLYNERKYGFIFFRTSPAKLLSFPSGHANTIAAFMTALYLIKPRYRFIYLLIALMVMASRIVIGKHFVSDVVAGAYLGVLTNLLFEGLFPTPSCGHIFETSPSRALNNQIKRAIIRATCNALSPSKTGSFVASRPGLRFFTSSSLAFLPSLFSFLSTYPSPIPSSN